MNSNKKKPITIDGKVYMISSCVLDEIWKISLTNLNDLFVEKLSRQDIIERCERLNPLLAVEDIDVDQIIRELFDNIPKYAVDTSTVEKIKLHTVIEGGTFKFVINLNRADSEEFGKEIMIPLACYIVELQDKFNDLVDEIKRKDEEILEYKACGAKLIRNHIKTKRFNANSWLPSACEEYKEILSMCQLISRDNKIIKLEKNIKTEAKIGETEQEKFVMKSQSTESELNSSECKKRKTTNL